MHDDPQAGGETPRLRRPVADDSRRGDHQRRPVGLGASEVGQHGRGLAEAHVEGQAAAEADGVEEVEPPEGLGLVVPQLSLEALGIGHRFGGREVGGGEELGGPASADDRDATAEGGALEADGVTEDLGPSELGLTGPLGERGGGFLEIGPVEGDPLAARADQRPGFGRQAGHLRRRELDVVEHDRPADVGELVGADHALTTGLGEEAQRRRRLASRERRHAHLEPGRLDGGAGVGHELPGLWLGEVDLAAGVPGTGPVEHLDDAVQAGELAGQLAVVGLLGHGDVDRLHAVGRAGVDRQQPGVVAVGRVELHDEVRPVGDRDRPTPALEAGGDLGPGRGRGGEGRAVEPGDHGLGDVGRAPDDRRRRRELHHRRGPRHDRVDDGAEDRERDLAGVVGAEGGDGPGHGVGELGDERLVDQRRLPADREVGRTVVAGAAVGERGNDLTASDGADGCDHHRADPAEAGALLRAGRLPTVAVGAGEGPRPGGDQPAEGVTEGDRHGVGAGPAGEADPAVLLPARGRGTGGIEAGAEILEGGGHEPGASGPEHQPAGRPRRLEAQLGRLERLFDGFRRFGGAGEGPQGPPEVTQLVLEVGDGQLTLHTRSSAGRLEVGGGLVDHAFEEPLVLGGTGRQQRTVGVRGATVDGRPDRSFDAHGVGQVRRRSCAVGRHP